ncbi:unnamed protein product [Ixodes hexagonus]
MTDCPRAATIKGSRPVLAFLPELYVNANTPQRTVNIKALELVGTYLNSKSNRRPQFIDLGCGTGDFTCRELLPRCQPCSRIVATDAAEEMVRYARENFDHPQIEYEVHDISSEPSGLVKRYGTFDRVYSFFALHWVKNQVTAFRNISELMSCGGECVLTFVAHWTGFDIWRRIVQMDRWKSYKEVCGPFMN